MFCLSETWHACPSQDALCFDNPGRRAASIPGMTRVDGSTVGYTAKNMEEAFKLIRLVSKYVGLIFC